MLHIYYSYMTVDCSEESTVLATRTEIYKLPEGNTAMELFIALSVALVLLGVIVRKLVSWGHQQDEISVASGCLKPTEEGESA